MHAAYVSTILVGQQPFGYTAGSPHGLCI